MRRDIKRTNLPGQDVNRAYLSTPHRPILRNLYTDQGFYNPVKDCRVFQTMHGCKLECCRHSFLLLASQFVPLHTVRTKLSIMGGTGWRRGSAHTSK
jgi:hypothetical protein